MKNSVWLFVWICLTLVACSENPQQTGDQVAVISNIRMTFELPSTDQKDSDGHPVAGAIVGGAIAGTKGAVIGALVGNQSKEVTEKQGGLIACSFMARLPNGKTATFRLSGTGNSSEADNMRKCSTLRDGDVVPLSILKDYWVWGNPYSGSYSEKPQ